MATIGVISDTHGVFDESLGSIFEGVDLIVHAGDIGKLEVITSLESIAPVIAVEGNNDWWGRYPTERLEELAGRRVLIRHIFGEPHQLTETDMQTIATIRPDVVIFGHSHRPFNRFIDETLLFNPGSAGPPRFSLPRTVGLVSFEPTRIHARIVSLD